MTSYSGPAPHSTQMASRGSRFILAIVDLIRGLTEWRVWWVLAYNDIRQRYRRSTLGQFWLTAALAASIVGIGIVFGHILKEGLERYVPFLGIGLITWALLSGLINDLANSLINADTYLRSYPGPRSVVIYRTIARNFLIAAHNLLLVPLLIFVFDVPLTPTVLLAIPSLVLIALNAIWIGLLIGLLCARFRDLPPIIASITQLAFFVTPVIYRPEQLKERLWVVTHLNPFANFMEIVRAPLLGSVPDPHHYLMVALWTTLGFLVAIPFYARFRGRIVYWL